MPEYSDASGQEERLYAVLADFLESAESGALPDRAALLADHPELAPELEAFLDTWGRLESLTEPIRSASLAFKAATSSARIRAARLDKLRDRAMSASAEPENGAVADPGPQAEHGKPDTDDGGWLGRWLRQHPPLAAENYPFLNAPQPDGEIGRLGPYRLLEVIGSGGMGVVFRGEDMALQRPVAVKVLRSELAADPRARERFLREARAAAALDHENVIAVYHVGQEAGIPFLGMQWLRGRSVEDLLRQFGRLNAPTVLRLGYQMALGLSAAHGQGLLHRDIKPANLWIELSGPGLVVAGSESEVASNGRVKILDFGLARTAAEEGHLTQSGAAVGTPAYMSPEQASAGPVDARSDLYGLGVVLYRMCTGRLPLRGQQTVAEAGSPAVEPAPSVHDLNPVMPLGLSDLVMELLARDPARRPASAAEVANRLRGLEGRDSGPAAVPFQFAAASSPTAPGKSTGPRWLTCATLLAFALAVLLPLGYLFGGAVIRFATNKGEVVVAVDDPDMDVTVAEAGAVLIEDRNGKRQITLAAGEHELEVTVRDSGGEARFFTKRFVLHRGGKQVINVREELTPLALSPAPSSNGVDHSVAEWVLGLGGKVTVRARNRELEARSAKDLPAGDVRLLEANLSDTDANDAGMERLGALPEIRYLRLSHTKVGDAGLAYLAGLKSLRTLVLDQTRVSDAGLARLGDLTGLVDLELSSTAVSDAGLAHLEPLKNLNRLSLYNTRSSDAGLAHVRSLAHLHSLILSDTKVTDAGLAHVGALSELERLYLNNLPTTDAGLAHLKGLKKLRYLNLGGARLTDRGVEHLQGLTDLQELVLDYTGVSDAGLARLGGLQNLQSLGLSNTPVTDAALDRLRALTRLQVLILASTKVTDAGLVHLKDLSVLRDLDLNGTQVGDAGLVCLAAIKSLRGVSLAGTQVSDAGLVQLKGAQHLVGLDLSDTRVTDAGLAHLAGLTGLQNLRLSGSQVTDDGLAQLARLTDLQYLHLSRTRVTDVGLAQLEKLKHLRKLYLTGTRVTDTGLSHLLNLPLPPLTVLDLGGTRVSATGVAAVKGILPDARVEWWEPNRRATEAILTAGGSVHVRTGDRGSDVPIKDVASLPADYFRLTRAALASGRKPPGELLLLLAALTDPEFDDLEEVDLSALAVADANLESLGTLPCRRLVLDSANIRGPGLAYLNNLPRLTELSLRCPMLSFLGVRYAGELKRLERLSLAGTGATDASLKSLHELVELRELDLTDTKVTPEGVAALRAALPMCGIKAGATAPP
jgi:serine/threonine protein kinase/Leucine-rich repeat (LRR) protein